MKKELTRFMLNFWLMLIGIKILRPDLISAVYLWIFPIALFTYHIRYIVGENRIIKIKIWFRDRKERKRKKKLLAELRKEYDDTFIYVKETNMSPANFMYESKEFDASVNMEYVNYFSNSLTEDNEVTAIIFIHSIKEARDYIIDMMAVRDKKKLAKTIFSFKNPFNTNSPLTITENIGGSKLGSISLVASLNDYYRRLGSRKMYFNSSNVFEEVLETKFKDNLSKYYPR